MTGFVELHRHLDVSTRLTTLHELAIARELVPSSLPLAEFRRRVVIRRPMSSLGEVLARFAVFQRALGRVEDLERIAYEAVHDCHAEGTRAVELRFSPSFVCEHNDLSWKEALAGFHRGMERALAELPDMRAGLLLIATRDFGADSVARTAELYLSQRDRLIGIDLAGNETDYPCRLFQGAFRDVARAKAADPDGVHVTIHAGEGAGPDSVWEALELLGAERIGHGIRALEDPELVTLLRDRRICLEMCPTSNRITRAVPDLESHPLKRARELGLAATINTDDPTIFDVTLPSEIEVCRRKIGLDPAAIDRAFGHAAASTFLPAARGPAP